MLTVKDEDEATAKKLKPTISAIHHGSKKNYKANPHLTVPISDRLSLATSVAKEGNVEDKTPVIHKALCRKMEMTIVGVEVVGLCMV